jgi:hypothetical protein
MTTPERKIKNVRRGKIVRFEPRGLNLVKVDPTIRASFEQVGCIGFFEKLQGYKRQVAREFAENLDGANTKVDKLQFQFSEDNIEDTT